MLHQILEAKKLEIAELKKAHQDMAIASHSERNFLLSAISKRPSFIFEFKQASPSKGLMRPDFDLKKIAAVYNKYADCVSVLTDSKFFSGSYENIRSVRKLTTKPILHKDFILDPIQIDLGRQAGADAVLLMLSALDDSEYSMLYDHAKKLNLTVLSEVSNANEAQRLLKLKHELVGINNRNLLDLKVNPLNTITLAPLFKKSVPIISESGIDSWQRIKQNLTVANGFLVGSKLMAAADLNIAAERLIYGEHKVCGIRSEIDLINASDSGASYAGLIFVESSKRYVAPSLAKKLMAKCPIPCVGVFMDQPLAEIEKIALDLKLSAVQIHSNSDSDILYLRKTLPSTIEVWQALFVDGNLPRFAPSADRVVLDNRAKNGLGGSGQSFDWQLLNDYQGSQKIMLAGGINIDNLSQALKLPVAGLDLNSGVEDSPGVKSKTKLAQVFKQIKNQYLIEE